ncbi:MAG: trypsin-like peptidase domain-containing protein, partial [candidate division NC10 bacterium]|nr:trypsin-like peptidase domain-containing protein [candidate division NC10 bacterium]
MRQLNSVVKAVGGIAVILLLGYLFYFGGTDLLRSSRATATAAETKPAPEGWVPSRPDTLAPLVDEVKPAVVNIGTTQAARQPRRGFRGPFRGPEPFEEFFERFFGGPMPQEPRPQQSLGSGFIIDKDGYILTNNHVIENAGMIMVKLANEKEYEAKVIGRDPRTDLALIKINARADLPVVRVGDSDALRVGDWVIAIGNPFGLGQTVTAGIVSAKGRVIGQGPYDDFIQTDAAINPGNSGGPLFNTRGEVVGINTAIFSQSGGNIGIGFAVPVNMAKSLVPQLKAKGRV